MFNWTHEVIAVKAQTAQAVASIPTLGLEDMKHVSGGGFILSEAALPTLGFILSESETTLGFILSE